MADRGDEGQLVDEGAVGLLEDDQHFLGGTGDLRGAAGTRQAHFRVVVVTDHGGVDVAEAVHLGGAEEADVDAATLQPVAEDLAGGHHGVGGLGQLAVTDGQRQHGRLGADGAGFVDQHHVRGRGQARQVGSLGRQADADEADGAVLQAAGGRHGHHFIGAVVTGGLSAHHLASAILALNSAKSRVPRMYWSIQAVKVSRSRAIGSQAW
ncbi:hypothetical protein D3C80_508840 [compost metagenome]